ncbi:MAG TPA: P-loop NTPase fold protein [Terriglobales bacterium]|nr:P-loop NTPase fold protein [Terriglobales bacterium]
MWPDNETDRDFLNFTSVADTVAEIIVQAGGQPISIGISGAWGVGKSSMIKLVRRSIALRTKQGERDFVFVEFNAWLYQGYDDARAALMEVIGSRLAEEAQKRKKGVGRAKEFLERVRWFRLIKLVAGSAVALHAGMPPVGLLGDLSGLAQKFIAGEVTAATIGEAEKAADETAATASELIGPKKKISPPKEIHALRESFEETLSTMGVTLVVLIDDLDRCLPETTISTLEAIRLFLFLKNTAFIIAADDGMIKHAVRRHFVGVDDEVAANYFDKLVQLPIRVPPLGTQEVRAYMILLFVENSILDPAEKEKIRDCVCVQLGQTWQGKRVDRAFVQSISSKLTDGLIGQIDTAERLAPLMATASGIGGNPRLIKRFLNALAIRMAISRAHGVGVDEAVLVKVMLFERVANPKAYAELTKAVSENSEGKPFFLSEWEDKANAAEELKLAGPWDDPFVREWLTLPPRIAYRDLRGVLYVSREHAPLITPQDRLSSEAAGLLSALLEHPDMAATVKDRLSKLSKTEITVIMDRLLDRARQEQEWGVPPILEACLAAAEADPPQGSRMAAFLTERPGTQIKPNIVPKIADQPWAKGVLETWDKTTGVSAPVKAAIKQQRKQDGNVRVQ